MRRPHAPAPEPARRGAPGGYLTVQTPSGGIGRSAPKLRGEISQESSFRKLGKAKRRDSSGQPVGSRRSARADSMSRRGVSSAGPPPSKFSCRGNRPLAAADLGGESRAVRPPNSLKPCGGTHPCLVRAPWRALINNFEPLFQNFKPAPKWSLCGVLPRRVEEGWR